MDSPVAIVTGSGSGIGEATALQLADAGYRLVLNCSRHPEAIERVARTIASKGGEAVPVVGDVALERTARELVDAAERTWGRLDVLVNNAAYTQDVPFPDLDSLTDELWERIFHVNVMGTFYCSRAARKLLAASGRGSIVNLGSVAGLEGFGSCLAYAASKAAIHNLTIGLARSLAPGIRVNCVIPGYTDTPGNAHRVEARRRRLQESMLQRIPSADEVARVVVAVATGLELVTAQQIVVDGGRWV